MWSEDVFVMCLLNPTQNKSIPGSSRSVGLLAVLLIRHLLVLFHLLSGWASLHPGEELLSRSWEDFEVVATVRFTCFTKSWDGQVACALQPTGMRQFAFADCLSGLQVALFWLPILLLRRLPWVPVPRFSQCLATTCSTPFSSFHLHNNCFRFLFVWLSSLQTFSSIQSLQVILYAFYLFEGLTCNCQC